jgi:hypothetical protein
MGAGLAVLAVLAAGARLLIQDWLTWFWALTAIAFAELLLIAAWDLAAAFDRNLPHLVTDQDPDDRWPPWAHAVLVPSFLVLGVLVDHLWVH